MLVVPYWNLEFRRYVQHFLSGCGELFCELYWQPAAYVVCEALRCCNPAWNICKRLTEYGLLLFCCCCKYFRFPESYLLYNDRLVNNAHRHMLRWSARFVIFLHFVYYCFLVASSIGVNLNRKATCFFSASVSYWLIPWHIIQLWSKSRNCSSYAAGLGFFCLTQD